MYCPCPNFFFETPTKNPNPKPGFDVFGHILVVRGLGFHFLGLRVWIFGRGFEKEIRTGA